MGTPCDARTDIVRAPNGNLQCFSYPTGPVSELAKIPHGRRIWPYGARTGPLRSPHGRFAECLWSLNPYGARKLIMHAWKLYGPCTGRQNLYGAARGPCRPREWTCDFFQNSPGTACMGLGSVMWLRHHIQPRAPYNFYHPYDFSPVRPSEAPVGILRRCYSSGHIRLRAPYCVTRLCNYSLFE